MFNQELVGSVQFTLQVFNVNTCLTNTIIHFYCELYFCLLGFQHLWFIQNRGVLINQKANNGSINYTAHFLERKQIDLELMNSRHRMKRQSMI